MPGTGQRPGESYAAPPARGLASWHGGAQTKPQARDAPAAFWLELTGSGLQGELNLRPEDNFHLVGGLVPLQGEGAGRTVRKDVEVGGEPDAVAPFALDRVPA